METVILRKRSGAIHYWKKYEINSVITYTWNRWNLVSTTTYKWDKYDAVPQYASCWRSNATGPRYVPVSTSVVWESYTLSGSFRGRGTYYGTPTQNNVAGHCIIRDSGRTMFGPISSYYGMSYNDEGQTIGISTPVFLTTPGTSSSGFTQVSIPSGLYDKGSTSYGQVTSSNSNTYPSNGVSGSYWYVSSGSDTTYSKGSTQQPDVTSTSPTAYPENGHDGSYWYDNRTSNTTHSMGSYIEDIFSTDPSKYPANGISGSFWYVYQGQL